MYIVINLVVVIKKKYHTFKQRKIIEIVSVYYKFKHNIYNIFVLRI